MKARHFRVQWLVPAGADAEVNDWVVHGAPSEATLAAVRRACRTMGVAALLRNAQGSLRYVVTRDSYHGT